MHGYSTGEKTRLQHNAGGRFAAGIISIGVLLRLRSYAAGRDLWLDEAYVASSLSSRSFAELFAYPLDYFQAVPIGVISTLKLVHSFLGKDEYALRLLPLLCGIATLLLLWPLLRSLTHHTAALLLLGYAAFCPSLIYYSSEVKQYAVEALFTVTILYCYTRVLRSQYAIRNVLSFGIVGVFAIFFSYGPPLVLAVCGLFSFLGACFQRRQAVLPLLCIGGSWVVAAGVNYLYFLRPLQGSAYLDSFWKARGGFPPEPFFSSEGLHWLYWQQFKLLQNPVGFDFPGLAVFLILLGVLFASKDELCKLAPLFSALLLSLLLALCGLYPFAGRIALYSVPLYLLLLAFGFSKLAELGGGKGRLLFAGAALLLFFNPTVASVKSFISPPPEEQISEMLQVIEEQSRPGDILVVSRYSRAAFDYYRPRYDFSNLIIETQPFQSQQINPAFQQDGVLLDAEQYPQNRVWLLFSQSPTRSGKSMEESSLLARWQNQERARRERRQGQNSWLYLLDRSEG